MTTIENPYWREAVYLRKALRVLRSTAAAPGQPPASPAAQEQARRQALSLLQEALR